jgi:hypothetical protein
MLMHTIGTNGTSECQWRTHLVPGSCFSLDVIQVHILARIDAVHKPVDDLCNRLHPCLQAQVHADASSGSACSSHGLSATLLCSKHGLRQPCCAHVHCAILCSCHAPLIDSATFLCSALYRPAPPLARAWGHCPWLPGSVRPAHNARLPPAPSFCSTDTTYMFHNAFIKSVAVTDNVGTCACECRLAPVHLPARDVRCSVYHACMPSMCTTGQVLFRRMRTHAQALECAHCSIELFVRTEDRPANHDPQTSCRDCRIVFSRTASPCICALTSVSLSPPLCIASLLALMIAMSRLHSMLYFSTY